MSQITDELPIDDEVEAGRRIVATERPDEQGISNRPEDEEDDEEFEDTEEEDADDEDEETDPE